VDKRFREMMRVDHRATVVVLEVDPEGRPIRERHDGVSMSVRSSKVAEQTVAKVGAAPGLALSTQPTRGSRESDFLAITVTYRDPSPPRRGALRPWGSMDLTVSSEAVERLGRRE
jgi:hypothetical protein